jgi:hypothetical protein
MNRYGVPGHRGVEADLGLIQAQEVLPGPELLFGVPSSASTLTTRLASNSNAVSSARCFAWRTATTAPPDCATSGPNMANSSLSAIAASVRPKRPKGVIYPRYRHDTDTIYYFRTKGTSQEVAGSAGLGKGRLMGSPRMPITARGRLPAVLPSDNSTTVT